MNKQEINLRRIDHVRFFVGNARQSAYFYRNAFGFNVVAYAGLETKVRNESGYVLRQGEITFVLASPLNLEHPDSSWLVLHGDGVQDIALEVADVTAAYNEAVRRGAIGVKGPTLLEDENGVYEYATIRTYDLLDRKVQEARQRDASTVETTSWQYDHAGNGITVAAGSGANLISILTALQKTEGVHFELSLKR